MGSALVASVPSGGLRRSSARRLWLIKRCGVPKYKVTGGADGVSGVEIDGKRHEPGDEFETTSKRVQWLVDDGYLQPVGKARATTAEGDD